MDALGILGIVKSLFGSEKAIGDLIQKVITPDVTTKLINKIMEGATKEGIGIAAITVLAMQSADPNAKKEAIEVISRIVLQSNYCVGDTKKNVLDTPVM